MAVAELTNYYMGHGGMYYVEVRTTTATLLHLIVDAGTNPAAANPQKVADNLEAVVARVAARPMPVVVCLTHAHLDHYSHLATLLDKLAAQVPAASRTVYLTANPTYFRMVYSLSDHNRLIPEQFGALHCSCVENEIFSSLVTRHAASLRILDAMRNGQELLWASPGGEAFLYRLFTWITGDSDQNRNGTLFALYLGTTLIWFTGDLTGVNMRWLCEGTSQAAADIERLAAGATSVAVTVPHHGSIHTLEEASFISERPDLQKNSPLTTQNLKAFFEPLCGNSFTGACVSADFGDCYGHPDAWTMSALGEFLKPGVDSSFVCYKHVVGAYHTIADTKTPVRGAFPWEKHALKKTVLTTWDAVDPNSSTTVVYRNPSVVM